MKRRTLFTLAVSLFISGLLIACRPNQQAISKPSDVSFSSGSDFTSSFDEGGSDDEELLPYPPCYERDYLFPPEADTSLITGEPCGPPCWQGLTPGWSNRQQAMELMRTASFVDYYQLVGDPNSLERGDNWLLWGSIPREEGGHANHILFHADGIVRSIDVDIDYELSSEALIEIIGPPDGYLNQIDPNEAELCFPIRYVWAKLGFAAISYPQIYADDPAETQILEVIYLEPNNDLTTFLQELIKLGGATHTAHDLFEQWEGFDKIFTEDDSRLTLYNVSRNWQPHYSK